MWTTGIMGAFQKVFSHFQRGFMQTMRRTGSDGMQPRPYSLKSSSGPPWRLLFFGSDHFAVESLKLLTASSGILNVHPSLLPRWRGPAPIFHTILHGDTVTGVTIIQIHPNRFDVGPILNQELHLIPDNCTADELGEALAAKGAYLLIDTLKSLSERLVQKLEQSNAGARYAPKINTSLSWIVWEEQTCDQIDCLYRALSSRIPLRTTWMGKTIKLLDFVGKCHISLSDELRKPVPGSVTYQKESNILAVCCKDGWVGFKAVLLKKRLTATDFYNGYLHQTLQRKMPYQTAEVLFVSRKEGTASHQKRENSVW
ncbi:methionyl-tRNA formyltransferase, mitochondrial isoform X2 [Anabas testudineus]|uniref:methionyl-tRNA formyltransferase, mitochondrial isoform X2 n=1 Tax=Anabas testudineus TaxID=64144 RepID=UPI000E463AE9|nr:methionyl-tRNA formyltransferase, mitochondrial isoform X2 [Anabas testudineus]